MCNNLIFFALAIPVLAVAQPLTLAQCIERALLHNSGVRIARQAVDRAGIDMELTRAEYLPSVGATLFGYSHARTGPSIRVQENPTGEFDADTGQRIFREETTSIPGIQRSSYAFSASLSQTLYDGGRRANNRAAARREQDAADYGLRASRADVAGQVKQRFFEVLKAGELVEVGREGVKLSEKQLEDARARREVGFGTEVDVLRLQVTLENARMQVINYRQGVVIARARLNHIMGESIRAPLAILPPEEAQWGTPALDDSLSTMLARAAKVNPALKRLYQQVASAEHNVEAVRSSYFPQVGANIGYSRNNEMLDRVYSGLDQNYRLNAGLGITYNIFDGGIRQANGDRAYIALETARTNLEQQRRDLALSIELARLELLRLEEIRRVAVVTVELAKQDLGLARERYRVGKGRLLEALDAQVSFIEVRSNLVRTRYDLKIAEAELMRLMGAE